MSQIYKALASGGLPGNVLEEITTDFQADLVTPNGHAFPSGNNINLLGGPGIETYVDPDNGDNVYVKLENGCEDTATTTDAVPQDIICLNLGTDPGAAMVETKVTGFAPTLGNGVAYFLTAGARTDGVTATLIGTPDKLLFEDAALIGCDATIGVSGNNIIITITGIALTTIKWREVTTAIFVENNF